MTQRREPNSQPALIPLYGNVDKKPRFIDRDVIAIGRARGCDLVLDAADVSTIHCLIFRTTDGYRLRDCGSRTGTRVNGEPTRVATVNDGDILQLGTFSFEVRIPAELFPRDGKRLDPVRFQHLTQSRKHLAQLAIRLRGRLCLAGSPQNIDAELNRKLQGLRDKVKAYDARISQMESAEQELEEERLQLRREKETLHERVAKVEGELSRRLEDADLEIRNRWAEFQVRCQEESHHLRDLITAPTQGNEELEQREQELRAQEEELLVLRDKWEREQKQAQSDLDKQQAVLHEQTNTLRTQRNDLTKMMMELKKLQEELRKQPKADLSEENTKLKQNVVKLQEDLAKAKLVVSREQNLEDEKRQLQGVVEELNRRLDIAQTAPKHTEITEEWTRELDTLQAENELLRKMVDDKNQQIVQLEDAQVNAPSSADEDELNRVFSALSKLREENHVLQELLETKDRLMEEMQARPAPAAVMVPAPVQASKNANELEMYEAELNQFRRELQAEKLKVESEREQMRQRTEEMDNEIRDLEMQMSRERAEMGRERQRLDRMREELRADVEKAQREVAVRDTLAPVQKLRDELMKKPGAGGDRFRSSSRNFTDVPS